MPNQRNFKLQDRPQRMSKRADSTQTLSEYLAEQIRGTGPITFHDWMEYALYDEYRGYYHRADLERWGRKGDYRTAPEVSALFAATFGRYFASLVQHVSEDLTLLEIGAGAGDFAAKLLDTLHGEYPAVFQRTTYVVDEISKAARARIANRLTASHYHVAFKSLGEIDSLNPGIVFANEVLDAFPVHRVLLREGKLREFYVKLNEENGSFEWLEGPISTDELPAHLERFGIKLREGQTVEINSHIARWFAQIAEKLQRGYLVIVDYGAEGGELYANESRMHGTLRAFKHHELVADVLKAPGDQDITSTVDWTVTNKIARDLGFHLMRFERLDQFMLKEGLVDELEQQVTRLRDEFAKVRLRTSAREMILPSGMAHSFQVLIWKR